MATLGGNVRAVRVPGHVRRLPAPGQAGVPRRRARARSTSRRPTRSTSAGCCRSPSTTCASWLDGGRPRRGRRGLRRAERQPRQPHRRGDCPAPRRAGCPVHRRLERQRRAARLPGDRHATPRSRRSRRFPTRWTSATRATSRASRSCTPRRSGSCAPTSSGCSVTEDETRRTIREVYRDHGLPARPALGRRRRGGAGSTSARSGERRPIVSAGDGAPGEVRAT